MYASTRSGIWRLWRIAAKGGETRLIAGTAEYAALPTTARAVNRLAYEVTRQDENIWQAELRPTNPTQNAPKPLIHSSYRDSHPKFSPKGDLISYTSDQSGVLEIWVCDSTGGNPRQLTRFNGPFIGVTRWSPDGREIVFPCRQAGNSDLFIVNAANGQVRQLTTETSNEWLPSWSADGQWVYFHFGPRKSAAHLQNAPAWRSVGSNQSIRRTEFV